MREVRASMWADMLHSHCRRGVSLLIVAAICLAFGGCAEPLPPEHKAAVARMQGLGGKVMFAEGGYRLNMQNSRLADDDLKELHKIRDLKVLDLEGTQITDEGLKEIAKLKSVVTVALAGTATTREGCQNLRKARPDMSVKQ